MKRCCSCKMALRRFPPDSASICFICSFEILKFSASAMLVKMLDMSRSFGRGTRNKRHLDLVSLLDRRNDAPQRPAHHDHFDLRRVLLEGPSQSGERTRAEFLRIMNHKREKAVFLLHWRLLPCEEVVAGTKGHTVRCPVLLKQLRQDHPVVVACVAGVELQVMFGVFDRNLELWLTGLRCWWSCVWW